MLLRAALALLIFAPVVARAQSLSSALGEPSSRGSAAHRLRERTIVSDVASRIRTSETAVDEFQLWPAMVVPVLCYGVGATTVLFPLAVLVIAPSDPLARDHTGEHFAYGVGGGILAIGVALTVLFAELHRRSEQSRGESRRAVDVGLAIDLRGAHASVSLSF